MDNTFNNTSALLALIEDLFIIEPEDKEQVLIEMGLSEEEFSQIQNGDLIPDKIQNEGIYNFAYNHKLFVNEIIWQSREDAFKDENVHVCSHGSRRNIVGDIRVDLPVESSDFGSGFYIGQDIEQAGRWVSDNPDSSLYIFTFEEDGLKKALFNVSIDWMLAICYHRHLIDDYIEHPKVQKIIDLCENSDFILAPIADNKLYDVIESFTNEEITDLQCLYAISATHLGYQFVLKTEKALENLNLQDHLYFCSEEKKLYENSQDLVENTALYKAFLAKKNYKNQGRYISELLGDATNGS